MNINDFSDANNNKMVERIRMLLESKKWDVNNFKNKDAILAEMRRLNDAMHREDMPSFYYESIERQLAALRKKLDESESEIKVIPEKRVISEREFLAEMKKIEERSTNLKEEAKAKKQFMETIETDILSEDVIDFGLQSNRIGLNEARLPRDPNRDPEFGVPEQKKYPLFDEKHVRSAIRLFGHVEPKYESQLAHRIISKMKTYNIPFDFVGEDNKLFKYLPKKELTEAPVYGFDEKGNSVGEVKSLKGETLGRKEYEEHKREGLPVKIDGKTEAFTPERKKDGTPKGHVSDSDHPGKYYKTVYSPKRKLVESVLDPIHKDRCREIFDENDIMKPEVKKFIINQFEEFRENCDTKFEIKEIYMIGSSTGFQYTDTSDCDISIICPELVSNQEDFNKVAWILPNGHNIPGTQHPVNYYLTEEVKEENAENIYDLKSDTWLKKTGKEESAQIPTAYIMELSKFFMNAFDLTLKQCERDLQEYKEYKELNPEVVEISEKEKKEALDKKLVDLKADLDSVRMGRHVLRAFLHEVYNGDEDPFEIHIEMNMKRDARTSVNNLVYKMLEKFGYRDRIDNMSAMLEDFIAAESPSTEKEDVEENNLQERINPWQKGEEDNEIHISGQNPNGSYNVIHDDDKKGDEPKEERPEPKPGNPEDKDYTIEDHDDERTHGNYTKKNEETLTESVTYIDNAGNLKTTSTPEYVENMHKYDTKTQIKKFKALLRKRKD